MSYVIGQRLKMTGNAGEYASAGDIVIVRAVNPNAELYPFRVSRENEQTGKTFGVTAQDIEAAPEQRLGKDAGKSSENGENMIGQFLSLSGQPEQFDLPLDDNERILKLEKMVGGSIEVVPLSGQRYLVFNEEGKVFPHEVNKMATDLAHADQAIHRSDYIAGPAVVIPQAALQ